ncbi:MAG: hypothetical protein P8J20_19895 [Novosphingobium sp.]|nr:hypothetical protein [Novosphingobium sp.]
MTQGESSYPAYPPGLWRRIVLQPGPGWIGGALEDDMHSFRIRLDQEGGRITSVHATPVRTPWSMCPGAATHIEKELTGELLSEVAARDPSQQCTHLFDLAILCAAHAGDSDPTTFDMQVADRVGATDLGGGLTSGTLSVNGVEKMHWQLDGTMIEAPERFAGRDMKRVSRWKHEFPPEEAEWATLLRRAIFIAPARVYDPPFGKKAGEMGEFRMGVCYNYQEPQIHDSEPLFDKRDFSMSGKEPLEAIDHEKEFSAMGEAA